MRKALQFVSLQLDFNTLWQKKHLPWEVQTRFQKSWDTVQIVNKKGMQ